MLEEMRNQIVIAIRHANLYAGKVKDALLTRNHAQCATYNMALTFTNDGLSLGSKSHNSLLFVAGYIRGKWLSEI